MFVHYRNQGIILKKTDRGEADQLFTIYTEDFGKLDILAKAVRKISSKLRSSTELFYLSEIEFIQGKTQKTLTDAILIEKFKNLRNDLKKLRIAYKISELAQDLIKGPEKDPKIWQLLNETFSKLTNLTLNPALAGKGGVNPNRYTLFYYYFFWNLVSLLGYRPALQGCAIQGKKTDCDIVKIIKVILKKDWRILPRIKLQGSHLKLLKKVSDWYRVEINSR